MATLRDIQLCQLEILRPVPISSKVYTYYPSIQRMANIHKAER